MKNKTKSSSKRGDYLKSVNLVVIFLFFALLTSPETLWAQKKIISIGTAQIGGVWYPYGGTIANVITKYLPGIEVTAEVTNGGVDNAKLIGAGKMELALMTADVGYDAFTGKSPFKEKIPIRNLVILHSNYGYCVCLEGKGINSVRDLKGKRVSTSPPASGAEVLALRILEAYGMDPNKDIIRERLSAAESSGALKDRKIDAFFWNGGIPAAAIMDLAATPGIKIKLIPLGDITPKLTEKYGPIYFKAILPAKTYKGVDYDVSTVGLVTSLICHEKLDENLAHNIVRVLFEQRDELIRGHQAARDLKLENAEIPSPFPYHPGAIRYYKEKGLKVIDTSIR